MLLEMQTIFIGMPVLLSPQRQGRGLHTVIAEIFYTDPRLRIHIRLAAKLGI